MKVRKLANFLSVLAVKNKFTELIKTRRILRVAGFSVIDLATQFGRIPYLTLVLIMETGKAVARHTEIFFQKQPYYSAALSVKL